jgi:FlaA1/EpsC-like NDP-sugar epimerase
MAAEMSRQDSRALTQGTGARLSIVAMMTPVGRTTALVAADGLFLALGICAGVLLRFNFVVSGSYLAHLWILVVVALIGQVAAGLASGIYRHRWRAGSFEEVAAVVWSVAGATAAVFVFNWFSSVNGSHLRLEPASAPVSGGLIALCAMLGARYCWRLRLSRRHRPAAARKVLVLGAGDAGASLVRSMLGRSDSPFLPVGLLDDDPALSRLCIMGVRVLGTRVDLARIAARTGAEVVVIAAPSAPPSLVREVSDLAEQAGVEVRILPGLRELAGELPKVSDLRTPTMTDFLGRGQVCNDIDASAAYLTGRRVLVTGAGGSIGSELCRQVSRFAPAALVMLDRDESALHALSLSMQGRATMDDPDLVLADLRDRAAMQALLADRRPEVVFHAAALKHLPVLEAYPQEAIKTNVWGTAWLLEAARATGVERFVNISTDKAADPISVLGYTKRIAERLTAAVDAESSGTFLSVRFGNVLGSRGSVLTTFSSQIAAGQPLTVTHPDVTRYLMTVEEAVELVIQAGSVGRGGEALVLDMGVPVRIDDLARRMAALAGVQPEITYTGLRPGEKLVEVLLGQGEEDYRPIHPLISHVPVPPLAMADLVGLAGLRGALPREALIAALAARASAPAGAVPGVQSPFATAPHSGTPRLESAVVGGP